MIRWARRSTFILVALAAAVAYLTLAPTMTSGSSAPPPETPWESEMVSVTSAEVPGNRDSAGLAGTGHSISDDGRLVVFESEATNLEPADQDLDDGFDFNITDIFLRDRQTGVTTMIKGPSGQIANERTEHPAISGDGKFVAFATWDNDLLGEPQTLTSEAIAVKNLATGAIELISRTPAGEPSDAIASTPSLSTNGRYVTFTSNADDIGDSLPSCDQFFKCLEVWLYDRQTEQMQMVSVSSSEQPGDGDSYGQAPVNDDGTRVAFNSLSSNLVANDTNPGCVSNQLDGKCYDVFIRDVVAGNTTLASVAANGGSANGSSTFPDMSANGRFVVFTSGASNLVAGDNNTFCDQDQDNDADDNCSDIFVRDVQLGTTTLISRNTSGEPGHGFSVEPSISSDGRYVAFHSDAPDLVEGHEPCTRTEPQGGLRIGCTDVYVYDRQTGEMTVVSRTPDSFPPNNPSFTAKISGDGEVVAYGSKADDINPTDGQECTDFLGTHTCLDIFAAERVDLPEPTPTEPPIGDYQWRAIDIATIGTNGQPNEDPFGILDPEYAISADGRFVAFATLTSLENGDTNNLRDIYVRDRVNHTTERVSVTSAGAQATGGYSSNPDISADGRYVVFESGANNLVPGDTNNGDCFSASCDDIFLHDRQTHTTTVLSKNESGEWGTYSSTDAAISADGETVVFASGAENLTSDDTVRCDDIVDVTCFDIFRWDRGSGDLDLVSRASNGNPGDDYASYPALSADGNVVAWLSAAGNLAANDNNSVCSTAVGVPGPENCADVFVRNLTNGQTTLASVSSTGVQGSENVYGEIELSGTGRYVVFQTFADELGDGTDNCGFPGAEDATCVDVFRHDMQTGETLTVSRSSSGGQVNSTATDATISDDGRYVAFESIGGSWIPGVSGAQVYVRDMQANTLEVASNRSTGAPGNGYSPRISGDGDSIVVDSYDAQMVPGDTNDEADLVVLEKVSTTPPTITPSAPPTPGPVSGHWGDHDCDGDVSSRDNQSLQRHILSQAPLSQTEPCPDIGSVVEVSGFSPHTIGDNDCDGEISTRDNQALLRFVLDQAALSQTEPCPNIGQEISSDPTTATPGPTLTPTSTPGVTQTPEPTVTPTATPGATQTPGPTITAGPTVTAATITPPPPTATPVPTNPPPSKDCINGNSLALPDDGGNAYIYYTFEITETRTLTNLDICVNIDHTRVGDLTISLKHGGGGAQVILLDRPGYAGSGFGCMGDNIRILFDDDATTYAENVCSGSSAAIIGTYKPVEPLSFFNGESLAGTWFLEIYDVSIGETGTTLGAYMWWNVQN